MQIYFVLLAEDPLIAAWTSLTIRNSRFLDNSHGGEFGGGIGELFVMTDSREIH
jgi:hypothetical protein